MASAIHILHVVPGLGPGGMELAMASVIRGLADEGLRHSIIALKGEAEIADRLPPRTLIHCLRSRPNEPQLPARIARLIRAIRPTVIHARNWGAWPDTAVGRLLAFPIVPLIFSFHGLGKAGYMPLRRRLASRVLARITTELFTVSEQSKRMLVARWGWPDGRTGVIPNGVDTERFRPAAPGRSPGERPPHTGRFVIGTVGNLRPVKNHAMLIRACAALLNRDVDVELRIAGDGEERDNLLTLAKRVGFADRLVLAGAVKDVPAFLHGLDVFALSSDSEQHPNALNEAMACGLACAATSVGCVDELLDDGRCGLIVPPGDAGQMADALAALLADEDLRRRLGQAARQRARERYSLQGMVAAYAQLYRRLALGRRGHA